MLDRAGAGFPLLILGLWLLPASAPAGQPSDSLGMLAGEPSRSDVLLSEKEWAAWLVEAFGLEGVLPEEPKPADRFGLLCAEEAELELGPGGRQVPADSRYRVAVEAPQPRASGGPVRVVVSVPATVPYQLTVEGIGFQRWVIDGEPVGHLDLSALGVAQATRIVPLRAGPHEISGYLLPGARVDRVELAAYRALCVAPADGWHQQRELRTGAMARTLVRAFGFDRRLPELDEERQQIQGERFDQSSAGGGRTSRKLRMKAEGGAWASAVSSPAEFTWSFRLEHPRVVTLEALTHGAEAQLWSLDGRYRVSLYPQSVAGGFAWNHVVTLPLSSGRHVVRALLPRGSGVDALRVNSHRSADTDHVAVLRHLGFPLGPSAAPVTRSGARKVLASPSFVELAGAFRLRMEGDPADRPLALVEDEPDPHFSRPISPLLPADL